MYRIYFYEDLDGNSPIYDWIEELSRGKGKDARINARKVNDYITLLQYRGLAAGEPFIKHLVNDIWELRPLKKRILFAAWNGDGFILLHQFQKKTQKTPRRELEKAAKELSELRQREGAK